jgi:pimeloyl-ACP methyl ester carboxylesterase
VLLSPIVRDAKPSWLAKVTMKLAFAGPWRVWFWTSYWNSLFPTHKPADQAQIEAALSRNLHEPGRMTALQTMIELSKADTTVLLPRSRIPALVVMGTLDPDFTDATAEARWVASQISAQTLIVDRAGHYPHTEMPEQVAPNVISFIEHLKATPTANSDPGSPQR